MSEPNNVTPFRPRPKPAPSRKSGFDPQRPQHKVLAVHGLTIATFLIYQFLTAPWNLAGLGLGVAAVAIASSNRNEGMPWAMTHHEFALRTVLIGGAVWMISGLLGWIPFLGLAISFVQLAVLVWVLVRATVGLVRALGRKPTPNPRTPLI